MLLHLLSFQFLWFLLLAVTFSLFPFVTIWWWLFLKFYIIIAFMMMIMMKCTTTGSTSPIIPRILNVNRRRVSWLISSFCWIWMRSGWRMIFKYCALDMQETHQSKSIHSLHTINMTLIKWEKGGAKKSWNELGKVQNLEFIYWGRIDQISS